jgi:hypothetical protein
MKKSLLLIAAIITLSGCSYFDSKTNPPTQREQLCAELKRNLIFNTTSIPNIGNAPATQRAQSMKLYEKYNCNDAGKK